MYCPLCRIELRVAERQGVEIDHCPQCRGVWLDRGELDKIIERSAEYENRSRRSERESDRDDDERDERRERQDRYAQSQPASAPAPYPNQPYPAQQPYPYQPPYPHQSPYPTQHNPHSDERHHKRKRGGFLGELFDFD